jgi:uncharacterized protein YegL
MTDKNLTEIIAIIDRSGSMAGLAKETVGGYNSFLDEQKKAAGKARITLVQFDDRYQIDYEAVDVNDAKPLCGMTYVPRGMTALLDAVGKTVVSVGERLSKLPEEERPGQVIFLIITDGEENSSSEYQAKQVKEMVKHQMEKYAWTFVYMGGGNIESQKEQAGTMGFADSNVYGYSTKGGAATSKLYKSASRGISQRRDDVSKGIVVASPAASLLSDDEAKELLVDSE